VAEYDLDPDTEIQIRAVPPPEMVANVRADNIDGFLGPDPFNQRAVYDGVGFIHLLSKELWERHPASPSSAPLSPEKARALLQADFAALPSPCGERDRIAGAQHRHPSGSGPIDMLGSPTLRAALVSLALFGVLIGLWHIATMGSGPVVKMDPA